MKKKNLSVKPKNVSFGGTRTSIRLEDEMWLALEEISKLEDKPIDVICDKVYDSVEPGSNFTSALRVFIMQYFRKRAKKRG